MSTLNRLCSLMGICPSYRSFDKYMPPLIIHSEWDRVPSHGVVVLVGVCVCVCVCVCVWVSDWERDRERGWVCEWGCWGRRLEEVLAQHWVREILSNVVTCHTSSLWPLGSQKPLFPRGWESWGSGEFGGASGGETALRPRTQGSQEGWYLWRHLAANVRTC